MKETNTEIHPSHAVGSEERWGLKEHSKGICLLWWNVFRARVRNEKYQFSREAKQDEA